jgi:hypothetical protein
LWQKDYGRVGQSNEVENILKHTVEVAKQEIEEDIRNGAVPNTINSFSKLHDYVDANLYVNDAERQDRRIGPLGKKLGWTTQDYVEFTNRVIEEIDNWLKHRNENSGSMRA